MHNQFKTPEYPGVTFKDYTLGEINLFFGEPEKRSTLKAEASMACENAVLLWGAYVMHQDNPTRGNENWLIYRYAKYVAGQGQS